MILNQNSFVERQPVQYARNLLIERAREENADYIWFFDDDQVAQFDTLKLLLEADKDIVSGVVPLRHQEARDQLTNIFHLDTNGNKAHITDISQYIEPIIPVVNCGTGCVLIKRNVFEEMYIKYEGQCFEFQIQFWVHNKETNQPELYTHQDQFDGREEKYTTVKREVAPGDRKVEIHKIRRSISEDLCFFERCKELGYKIYAHLQAEVAHYGATELLKMKTHYFPPEGIVVFD